MNDDTKKYLDTLKKSIYMLAAEHEKRMQDNADPQSVSVFNGMLLYIYNKLFNPIYNTDKPLPNKRHKNTILEIDSPIILSFMWDIYSDLCSRYNKTLSVCQFCAFIGVDYVTLYRYASFMLKTVNQDTCEVAKKIFRDAESATYGQAVDGNRIGAIFALKAKFGYNDTKPQEIIVNHVSNASVKEIQDRYIDLLETSSKQLSDNKNKRLVDNKQALPS